ncbi:ABC transporter ATP-binding protein [Nonomuraea rubra]|uniref:ABC transporter ATP-binding protein n=1 Tax=Nonomuraea rubra TaxID=46180 RepID=UPI003606D3A0
MTATVQEKSGSWRGVASEDQDELPDKVSVLLRARSRRLLGELLRPYKKKIALLILIIVVSNAAGLSIPFLVTVGIDHGIPPITNGAGAGVLVTVVGVILAAAVTQALTRQAFLRLMGAVGQSILLTLRRRVFDHFQRLSLSFHENYTSGRVISRLTSDIEAIAELVQSGFDALVKAVLTLVGTAVLLLVLDVHLGLVALIPIPLLLLFTKWFQRQSAVVYRRTRETVALVIVHFVESMIGIRAVQAFRREPRNQEIFEQLNDDYRDANARSMILGATFMTGVKLIGNMTIGAVLLYGGYLALRGEVSPACWPVSCCTCAGSTSRCRRSASSTTRCSRPARRWRSCRACWRRSPPCPSRASRRRCRRAGRGARCASTASSSPTSRRCRSCRAWT